MYIYTHTYKNMYAFFWYIYQILRYWYIHIYIPDTGIHMCVYVCVYTHTYTRTHRYMCVYMYLYINIYVYIHIYITQVIRRPYACTARKCRIC